MTMTDLSNKPISYTGSHPLELAYRALLARVEAAEAEAARATFDHNALFGRYIALAARTEAAEAEAARLREAGRMVQEEVAAWRDSYEALNRQRLALAARVAELEAQLAWRPGSENPPAPDWYQVGDIGVGVYDLWYSGEAWHRSSFQGVTYRTPPMSAPDYWRPIPPLPPAPQETE